VQAVNMHKGMFMENRVEAQVDLIHANPFGKPSKLAMIQFIGTVAWAMPDVVADASYDGTNF
jgi:hypothetical protein